MIRDSHLDPPTTSDGRVMTPKEYLEHELVDQFSENDINIEAIDKLMPDRDLIILPVPVSPPKKTM